MKKTALLLLFLLLLLFVTACKESGQSSTEKPLPEANAEELLTFTLDASKSGYLVKKCSKEAVGVLTVPDTYEGKPIVGISKSAFSRCKSIVKITLPETVTSIEGFAFYACEALESINLPSGITAIGESAFYGCQSLKAIALPERLKTVEKETFANCTSLETLAFGISLRYIRESAFQGCGFQVLNIPKHLFNVEQMAFAECRKLTELNVEYCPPGTKLPSSAPPDESDGQMILGWSETAFYNCPIERASVPTDTAHAVANPSLTSIHLYGTVIGAGVFHNAPNLTSITLETEESFMRCENNCLYDPHTMELIAGCQTSVIPEGIVTIGNSAFEGCRYLKEITLPQSVTKIDTHAFYGCSSLREITLPQGVTHIGNGAFSYCVELEKITMYDQITAIEEYAFRNCDGILEKENGVTYVGRYVISADPEIAAVTLRPDTLGIADVAFRDCDKLKQMLLPDGLTSIGGGAFSGCDALKKVVIPKSIKVIGVHAFNNSPDLIIYIPLRKPLFDMADNWNGNCRVYWDYKPE